MQHVVEATNAYMDMLAKTKYHFIADYATPFGLGLGQYRINLEKILIIFQLCNMNKEQFDIDPQHWLTSVDTNGILLLADSCTRANYEFGLYMNV